MQYFIQPANGGRDGTGGGCGKNQRVERLPPHRNPVRTRRPS